MTALEDVCPFHGDSAKPSGNTNQTENLRSVIPRAPLIATSWRAEPKGNEMIREMCVKTSAAGFVFCLQLLGFPLCEFQHSVSFEV